MKCNKLRVVCNPIAKHISYYYKNEIDEWLILSGSSPLSRNYYTATTLEERVDEIILKIDEIYNRRNRGLEITFEGDEASYKVFQESIHRNLSDRNILCHSSSTKVIVTGKVGVGKTVLIEEIEHLQGMDFTTEEHDDYILYKDNNNTEWYEIKGIDFGRENIEKAYSSICKVVKNASAVIVYCIHSSNRRMESAERDFILKLIESFPELAGVIVLTQCDNKKGCREFIDEIEKMTDQMRTIPVLAQEFVTSAEDEKTNQPIIIPPFGLEELAEYVFEGR